MPWGLIVICLVVFVIVTACTRRNRGHMCPLGCRGCGRCMENRKER